MKEICERERKDMNESAIGVNFYKTYLASFAFLFFILLGRIAALADQYDYFTNSVSKVNYYTSLFTIFIFALFCGVYALIKPILTMRLSANAPELFLVLMIYLIGALTLPKIIAISVFEKEVGASNVIFCLIIYLANLCLCLINARECKKELAKEELEEAARLILSPNQNPESYRMIGTSPINVIEEFLRNARYCKFNDIVNAPLIWDYVVKRPRTTIYR